MPHRSLLISLSLALSLAAGCWTHIEDHCPGCTVLSEQAPDLPRLRADTPALVILVHGAFGFGDEWDQVVAKLKADKIDFYAWSWSGPWRNAPRSAERFARTLQETLNTMPANVRELVLIAHSAGGALVENAARRVRVPEGHSLRVVAIAPARVNLSAAADSRFSDDAMGQSITVAQSTLPPVPPRVSIEVYLTADAPKAAGANEHPGEPSVHMTYLGASVGHNESVPLAALPIIDEIARGSAATVH